MLFTYNQLRFILSLGDNMSNYLKTDKQIVEETAKRIAKLRIANGLSQNDVAKRTGLSRHTISNIENGNSFTVENLVKVMRALGIIDRLETLIPTANQSPYVLVKNKGEKKRVFSSKKIKNQEWQWGED